MEGSGFCGSCGAPTAAAAAPQGSAPSASASSGLTSNVAGALAYFTIIPAIIFLVMEPYNKDRFVKFHAFQCLFLAAASFVLFFGLSIVAVIPVIGWIIGLLLIPLLGLAIFVAVIFTMYKAYNNEKFMLPVIGKLADQQASK
ncbi:MAG: DUF4870 domain-containing protein [Terriglobia bacterium]|jgi:uncharacterized membrane protein